MRDFKYTPLRPEAIRTIVVAPEFKHGYISCELRQTTIQSRYRALSYTWDDAQDPQITILINDKRFLVRQNLFDFLQYARREYAGESLWIDAISIDQENMSEKNAQVKRMWEIFSRTEEVLMWLGAKYQDGVYAMRKMKQYYGMFGTEAVMRSFRDERFWRGIDEFATISYWSRAWVVTEVILPPRGRIILGTESMTLKTLQYMMTCLERKSYRRLRYWAFTPKQQDRYDNFEILAKPLLQGRGYLANGRNGKPLETWPIFPAARYCSDLRDRVWSVRPLLINGSTISVDYRLNALEVFLEALCVNYRGDAAWHLLVSLMFDPITICLYTATRTSYGERLLLGSGLPKSTQRAESLHVQAASSPYHRDAWYEQLSKGTGVYWYDCSTEELINTAPGLEMPRYIDGDKLITQRLLVCFFRRRCFALRIAISAQYLPAPGQPMRWLDYETYSTYRPRQQYYAMGAYRTTLAHTSRTVCYILYEAPEGLMQMSRLVHGTVVKNRLWAMKLAMFLTGTKIDPKEFL